MLGVVSTFVLPNTLEDILAIAVGGLVGYAALLNLPLRRNDAKEKLQRAASNFIEVSCCTALEQAAESRWHIEMVPHQRQTLSMQIHLNLM